MYLYNGVKYYGFQICKNIPNITYNITFIFDKVEGKKVYGRIIIENLIEYNKIMTDFEGNVIVDGENIINLRVKETEVLYPINIDYSLISISGYYNIYINKLTKKITGYYFDDYTLNLHNIYMCIESLNYSQSYEFN